MLRTDLNLFQTFFTRANQILTAKKITDLNKQVNECIDRQTKTKKKRNQIEQCEDNLAITLLVLCDLRRYLLGVSFTKEQISEYHQRCDHLESVSHNNFNPDKPLPRSIQVFNNYMILTACYAKLLVRKCESKNHESIIDHTLSISFLYQQLRYDKKHVVSEKQEVISTEQLTQMEAAYSTISEDKNPTTEAEHYLFGLNQLSLRQIFLVRAQLQEERHQISIVLITDGQSNNFSNTKTCEAANLSFIASIDSYLKSTNLIAFPACRRKLSAHTEALNQTLAQGNFAPFRHGALPSLPGIMTRLEDKEHYRRYILGLIEACKVIVSLDSAIGILQTDTKFKMYAQKAILKRMLSLVMCSLVNLELFEKQYLQTLPEARYINIIASILYCVKSTMSKDNSAEIDNNRYHAIDIHELKETWTECLIGIRPSVTLAGYKPVVAYAKMRDELLLLIREHQHLTNELKAEQSKLIIE